MSTQEEKNVANEELKETVENVEATVEETAEETQEETNQEPLSEVDQLKLQLAEAQEKNAELQDRYLRQAAEFDN